MLLLVVPPLINAQHFTDSITVALTQLSQKNSLVGFGVALVTKDSILYAKGFGYANKETKTPYTPQTVQPIASISKTLLAVALMKAQEMGKLQLTDPINQYLPFNIYSPNFPNEPITLQQLVNHTSSIVDGAAYDRTYTFKNKIPPFYTHFIATDEQAEVKTWVDMFNENEMMPIGEFIKKQYVVGQVWYHKTQNFSIHRPGTTYKYSNMGANIAAYIIERATGENYAAFVNKQIIAPLQMNNSGWRGKNFQPKNASTLYWYGYAMPEAALVTYPDGNLMTNLVDYGRFLSTMIRGYEGEDNVLMAESYQEMMKDPISASFRKGVFWSVDSEKIGHSGSDLGVLTHAYFLKENGIGILVFANTSDTANDTAAMRALYRTLLGYAKTIK